MYLIPEGKKYFLGGVGVGEDNWAEWFKAGLVRNLPGLVRNLKLKKDIQLNSFYLQYNDWMILENYLRKCLNHKP